MKIRTGTTAGLLFALMITSTSCASGPPATVGDCFRNDAVQVVLGEFPDKVKCPTEDRDVRERLTDPIYRVVAVGKTVGEVDADPACGDDISFFVWYDDKWAVCGEMQF